LLVTNQATTLHNPVESQITFSSCSRQLADRPTAVFSRLNRLRLEAEAQGLLAVKHSHKYNDELHEAYRQILRRLDAAVTSKDRLRLMEELQRHKNVIINRAHISDAQIARIARREFIFRKLGVARWELGHMFVREKFHWDQFAEGDRE
jgi:hypothetical protein